MLEKISDIIDSIPQARRLITPDVPVCDTCQVERFKHIDRVAEYRRCPECVRKLTEKLTWVKCPCGIESPYLEIIGRVSIQDIVTCAAGAEELLKNL